MKLYRTFRQSFLSNVSSFLIILSMLFSLIFSQPASARSSDGLTRQRNAQSGRVSFIGPESGRSLPAAQALGTTARPQDPAMALAKRFAPEFGLKDPEHDLSEMKNHESADGRLMVRYQQNHQGIPVMAGELIVNTNKNGDLYSISGEISPQLPLSIQPTIDSSQALETALQSLAKWYQKPSEGFVASEPELWIYDESLLEPSTKPAELVWRMDVTSKDVSVPVRELVLVNAERGGISLHFNQIDTAWKGVELEQSILRSDVSRPDSAHRAEQHTATFGGEFLHALAGLTYYVTTTGSDGNSCSSAGSPCATINGALGKSSGNDTIKVAAGTYTGAGTEVVLVNKNVTLSGGWNAAFSAQTGMSILDGQFARRGMTVNTSTTVSMERFVIQNGNLVGNPGGGIYNNNGTLTINRSTIRGNTAGTDGGGILNIGTLQINNSSVTGNAGSGGGLVNGPIWTGIPSAAVINNSTISGNSGGAIRNGPSGTLTLNNVTVSHNMASPSYAGGIYQDGGGTAVMKNTILALNTQQGGYDCSGTITSNGYNLIGSITGCTFSATTGDQVNVNPKLGELIGSPAYRPLMSGSPAINTGSPSTCLATDQRGVSRPQGAACDIGAYEYTTPGAVASLSVVSGDNQHAAPGFAFGNPLKAAALDSQGSPVANINVTFTAPSSGASGTFANTGTRITSAVTDLYGIATSSQFIANSQLGAYAVVSSASGAGSVNMDLVNTAWFVSPSGNDSNACNAAGVPCLTIQAALEKAIPGDSLLVAVGTYTGNSFGNAIPIFKNINLYGGWNNSFTAQTGRSTVDGQNAVAGIAIGGVTVTIDHFIVQNGYGNYNAAGGGISNNSGTLTVLNSIIKNNQAPRSGGGGIYSYGGTLTLVNSAVFNNTASSYGGGVYIEDQAVATIKNSTLSGNTSTGGNGGGIEVGWGNLTVLNSTIVNNQASSGGGGFHTVLDVNVIVMRNTILANNTGPGSPDCLGVIDSSDHNLLMNASGCTLAVSLGDQVNVNPKLGIFDSTQGYYPLLLGSPAIEAGNPVSCLATDQLGVSRPQGTVCDVGAIEYLFNHSTNLLLKTYTAGNATTLPGTFLCDQTDLSCAAGDSQAKAAHKYAAGTYNLYKNKHNRSSIDNAGIEILSAVHFDNGFDNAFWNGYMMIYGDAHGYALADDVVTHELTHGVTQNESNLFYYYQAGAINESLSDVWGEYYDQTNSQGNDALNVKWLLGEDITGLGALRSMSNPPTYGDPDKMSSANYYEGALDNGGVHTNSGVNNKAVYLMVDGGTFNGKTVTPLGWDKTAAIYYEVNTNLLASGADYSDLYYALQQACSSLIGQNGITAADCTQVKNAVDAVEMNSQPAVNFNTDAPLCSTYSPVIALADDLENGTSNWTFTGSAGRWQLDSPYGAYAQSGVHFLYADDYPPSVTDVTAKLLSFAVPNHAYLYFAQAYDFEADQNGYWDGGVLEYSLNSGSTWTDAGSLIEVNGYRGQIVSNYINPLKGRSAFVGSSHGYISSRLNLSSLAGQTVTFRWRMGLDDTGYVWGWWVDNIKLYTCGPSTIFADVANTYWAWNFVERLYNAGITGGCGTDPLRYCPEYTVNRAQMAVFLLRGIHGSAYSPPAVGASTGFGDVPTNYWAGAWIKQLAAEGITGGCGNGNYCPELPVTRDQMAVFLLRSEHGSTYSPPPVGASTGFGDVPTDYWAAAWIKQLVMEGITAGCGGGNYCPALAVSRAQMAVFLVRTFNLP